MAIAEDTFEREQAESAIPGSTKLLKCFIDNMKRFDSDFKLTPSTQLFIFDILTHSDNRKALTNLTDNNLRSKFCKSALVKPYLPLYRESVKQRKQRSNGKLGPLGGHWIETESPFIGSFYNATGREAWGHSDITGDALSVLKASRNTFKLTPGGIHFLQHASQVPDLYHWKDEVFHAHTPSEEDPTYQNLTREERIVAGQTLFKAHIISHIYTFLHELRINNISGALLGLGAVSHGVQDLVYHHGMTLGQHAGLAYAGGFENPDYPTGENKQAIEKEARRNTAQILVKAMELAGDCAWRKIVKWPGLGGSSVDEMSTKFWKHMDQGSLRQDIGYFSLISYYGMAAPYRDGTSKRKELDGSSPDKGLIQWDSRTILLDILNGLESDEQVKDESARLEASCHG